MEPPGGQRARPYAAWSDGSVLHLSGDIDQTNWLEVAENVAAELRAGVAELDLTRVGFFGAAGGSHAGLRPWGSAAAGRPVTGGMRCHPMRRR